MEVEGEATGGSQGWNWGEREGDKGARAFDVVRGGSGSERECMRAVGDSTTGGRYLGLDSERGVELKRGRR